MQFLSIAELRSRVIWRSGPSALRIPVRWIRSNGPNSIAK